MNFHKYYFYFLLMISSYLLHAQSFRWGPETKRNGYALPIDFHKMRGGGIVTLLLERKLFSYKYLLEQYDINLMQTKSVPFEISYNGKTLGVQSFIATRDGQFVISLYREPSTKDYVFFAHAVDLQNLSTGSPKELFRAPQGTMSGWRLTAGRDNLYETILSRDSSKVLFFRNITEKKAEQEAFNLTLYDASLSKKLLDREITLPYTNKDFEIRRVEVDNDGGVYLLGRRYIDRKKGDYVYTVLAYKELGSQAKEYTVQIPNVWVGEVDMAASANGELIFAGTYAASSAARTDGVIYFRIDQASGRATRVNMHPFPQQVKEDFANSGNAKKRGIYGFDLRQMLLHPDGGCTLVGEQFYIVQRTTTSRTGGTSTRTYYYRNTILAVSIRGSGDLDWMTTIPKAGVAVDPYSGLSYALATGPDKLYFLYMDNIKNLGFPTESKRLRFPRGRNAIVTQAVLDSHGRLSRTPVSSLRESRTLLMPLFSAQVSARQMVFYGLSTRRRASRIGSFTF